MPGMHGSGSLIARIDKRALDARARLPYDAPVLDGLRTVSMLHGYLVTALWTRYDPDGEDA
jgi:hypothetical protein